MLELLSILFAWDLSRRTDILIKTEDERAKSLIENSRLETLRSSKETQQMIEEGRRETKELLQRMDEQTAKIAELIIQVSKRPAMVIREDGVKYKS